jgi:two-component system sporulation sensor kinase A
MNTLKKQLSLKNGYKGSFWNLILVVVVIFQLTYITSSEFLEKVIYLFILLSVMISFYFIASIQKERQKETDEKLNQSEKKLGEINQTLLTLIEVSPLSIVVLDREGKIKKWNNTSERIFGWGEREVLGRPHPIVFYQKLLEGVLKDDMNPCVEAQCLKKNGSPIDIKIYSSPIRNDAGLIVGAIGIAEEITQHKKIEGALDEAEIKFRSIVEETSVGVSIIQDHKLLYVNPRFAEIFGYTQKELLERDVIDLVMTEDRPLVRENIHKRLTGEIKNIRYIVRGLKQDNRIIDVEVFGSQMMYKGKPAVISTLHDITERKQAEKSLRESEDRFALFMKHIPGVVFIKDGKGRYVYVNEFFEKIHKMKLAEWYGKTDDQVWPLKFATQFIANDHIVQQTGKPLKTIEVVPQEDVIHYWLAYKFPIINNDGDTMVAGIAIDITEQKYAEEALRNSEERFRSAFDYAAIGMTLAETNGRLLKVNDSFCKMVGYSEQELFKTPFQSITHIEDLDANLDHIKKLISGEIEYFQIEKRYIHKLGQIVWGMVSVSLVRDGKGNPLYFITQIQDITERKEAEELLRKSEKLSAVGQLAAGVAHEVRNPLTTVKGFVQLLQTKECENKEYYQIMLSEVERIEFIISEFLVLAEPQMPKFRLAHIQKILQSVISLIDIKAMMSNVKIHLECDQDIPFIECDQNKLKQVFNNILQNAIEAMPDGGNILITVKKEQLDKIQISFTDQGCGISKERISKLGEPFYSNKEKGTGLGLMISYKIIEEHRGRVSVESIVGQGSTFDVILPVLQNNLSAGLADNSRDVLLKHGSEK